MPEAVAKGGVSPGLEPFWLEGRHPRCEKSMHSGTKLKVRKTTARWVARVIGSAAAVAGVGLFAAGQGLAAVGTITVTSVYFDTTTTDHVEGLSYGPTWGGGPLATFTDSDACPTSTTCQPNTAFTAKILWGDGTPQTSCPSSSCTISAPTFVSGTTGSYDVAASHKFVDEKNCPVTACGFTVKVTATDTVDVVSGSGDNSANLGLSVKDQPSGPSSSPFSFAAQSGVAFSGQIGSFQDGNQLAVPTDGGLGPEYTLSITWGDGTAADTTSGTFTIGTCGTVPGLGTGQGCQVALNGTHTYATSGTFPVHILIKDGLAPATFTATSTANVGANRCTSATLTSTPSPANVPAGQTVAFTATAIGCSNPQFEYWIGYSNGSWAVLRTWGPAAFSWVTSPQGAGHYKVHVWANQIGASTAAWEAYASSDVSLTVCASAGLTPAIVNQAAGTTVAFTATSTGCVTPQYEYWIGYSNGTWAVLRTWGPAAFSWVASPQGAGTYTIHVWANNVGDSTTSWEAYASSTVTLT